MQYSYDDDVYFPAKMRQAFGVRGTGCEFATRVNLGRLSYLILHPDDTALDKFAGALAREIVNFSPVKKMAWIGALVTALGDEINPPVGFEDIVSMVCVDFGSKVCELAEAMESRSRRKVIVA